MNTVPKKNEKKRKEIEFNNPHIKTWFLSDIKQDLSAKTLFTYEKLLYRVSNYEVAMKNGKDLCYFNKNEILDMISYFRTSEATANVLISMIRRYFDFCMKPDVEFLTSGINFAAEIKSEDLRKVINTRAYNESIELNYEKIIELVEQLKNPRDKAIIISIFNLIRGFEFKDLINLKSENIQWKDKSIIISKDNGEMRVIDDIDDYTLIIFKMALNERVYHEDNNDINIARDKARKKKEKKGEKFSEDDAKLVTINNRALVTNDYIIRPCIKKNTRKKEEEIDKNDIKINKGDVYRVLKDLKDWTNKDWITSVDIYKAGIVYRMKKYMQKLGKDSLTIADVDVFAKNNDLEVKNPYRIYKMYLSQIAMDKEETEI